MMAMRELLLRVTVDEQNNVWNIEDANTGQELHGIQIHITPSFIAVSTPQARLTPSPLPEGRRGAILRFIGSYQATFRRAPTIREIADEVHIPSTANVQHHLAVLQRDGWIARDRHINRSIRLLRPMNEQLREAV